MIEVKESALSAFEENIFAGLDGFMEVNNRVGNVGSELSSRREICLFYFQEIDWLLTKGFEDLVALLNLCLKFLRKSLRVHEITHSQASPLHLVTVARTDPSLSRADLLVALGALAALIEYAVIRKDNVRAIADEESSGNHNALLSQAH